VRPRRQIPCCRRASERGKKQGAGNAASGNARQERITQEFAVILSFMLSLSSQVAWKSNNSLTEIGNHRFTDYLP
jgi:hypothetical protein